MKYILIFLNCIIISTSSFAETIGNVEYQLPSGDQHWEIYNEFESKKGHAIIYVPENTQLENTTEFFAVDANPSPSDLNDLAVIKKTYEKLYPKMNVNLWVLEKNHNSLLYEWSATENGEENWHGLGRVFATNEGTVLLGYQMHPIRNISDIAKAKLLWIPLLQNAKLKTDTSNDS